MKRVSARFGIAVSTSGCSHSSEAAISFSAEFLAPDMDIRPSSGPFPRIVSLSMSHGYEPEFGDGKARLRLFPVRLGLSGGIMLFRMPHSFPALKICP